MQLFKKSNMVDYICMYNKVLQWVPIPMGKWVGNGYGLGRMGGYEGPRLYND